MICPICGHDTEAAPEKTPEKMIRVKPLIASAIIKCNGCGQHIQIGESFTLFSFPSDLSEGIPMPGRKLWICKKCVK